jgi:hypothetical protein
MIRLGKFIFVGGIVISVLYFFVPNVVMAQNWQCAATGQCYGDNRRLDCDSYCMNVSGEVCQSSSCTPLCDDTTINDNTDHGQRASCTNLGGTCLNVCEPFSPAEDPSADVRTGLCPEPNHWRCVVPGGGNGGNGGNGGGQVGDPGGLVPCSGSDCNTCDIFVLIYRINSLFVGIGFAITTAILVWGGIRVMTAGGSQANYQKGLANIKVGLIGLLIVLGSWILIDTLIHLLTGTTGPWWTQPDC